MNSDLKLELVLAKDMDKTLLKNLYQLYLHDLSEFTTIHKTNEKGVFENNDVDIYYEKSQLIPLIIRCDGMSIGFIMLNTPPFVEVGDDYFINEVFILKSYRNKGFGKIAIEALFNRYKGRYSLFEIKSNLKAIEFWNKILRENKIDFEEKEFIYENTHCTSKRFIVK